MADGACGENAPHQHLANLRRAGDFLAVGGAAVGAGDDRFTVYNGTCFIVNAFYPPAFWTIIVKHYVVFLQGHICSASFAQHKITTSTYHYNTELFAVK